jgi:hypothetical protein
VKKERKTLKISSKLASGKAESCPKRLRTSKFTFYRLPWDGPLVMQQPEGLLIIESGPCPNAKSGKKKIKIHSSRCENECEQRGQDGTLEKVIN